MRRLYARRNFFGEIGGACAGWAVAHTLPLQATAGIVQPPREGEDYYDKLGVTKIINAAGTYTHLTASTMPPSAAACMI